MKVRTYVDETQVGALFKRSSDRLERAGRDAIRAAAADVAQEIKEKGDADISGAGNFGSRWTDGFNVEVTEGGGNVRIEVTEEVPYWRVFEDGAVIQGKPMLWIPLSFADDAQGLKASEFGSLFRVDRKSGAAPLLLSINDKQPKYFGKASVTIPKKFHLTEISRAAANKLPIFWRANLKEKGLK